MTLFEFIDISYSGLKAKFDLSTDAEKDAIIERLNTIQPGLGDALSKEREDLERAITDAKNPQEIADALLPMTQLQGIKIAVNEQTKKKDERK